MQPVGDGDGRAVRELLLDGCLDEAIGLQVYGSRGLIHDQNLGFPQQSPGQAQELPLPDAADQGGDHALAQGPRKNVGWEVPPGEFESPPPTIPFQNASAPSASCSLLPPAMFAKLPQGIRRPKY